MLLCHGAYFPSLSQTHTHIHTRYSHVHCFSSVHVLNNITDSYLQILSPSLHESILFVLLPVSSSCSPLFSR